MKKRKKGAEEDSAVRDTGGKARRSEAFDDGRTIADMNVDGMPWYVRGDEERAKGADASEHVQMTDEETRMYRFAAVRAALLVVFVFGLAFFLFIAFCDFIWFR